MQLGSVTSDTSQNHPKNHSSNVHPLLDPQVTPGRVAPAMLLVSKRCSESSVRAAGAVKGCRGLGGGEPGVLRLDGGGVSKRHPL